MERKKITNIVNIGKWEEVDSLELSSITKNSDDTTKLNGLIVRGYEMKFGKVNGNLEKYEKGCLDEFLENYFVKNKLNMPITIQHDERQPVGKVLLIETNSVGFYVVAYIPKGIQNYDHIKTLLANGILQGFSKEGWTDDYEFIYKKNGDFDYMKVNKMSVLGVSLVTTPANALNFEKADEIKNELIFKKEEEPKGISHFFKK